MVANVFRLFLFASLCGCGSSPALVDTRLNSSIKRLDIEAQSILSGGQIPGLAMAILNRDGIWALGVSGKTHRDGRLIVDNDRFHLGSNTKAMTATLVARFVEKGKLTWSTTIADLFPDARIHPKLWSVTVKQLLRHEAGLAAWTDPSADPNAWRIISTTPANGVVGGRAKIARGLIRQPPKTAVGAFAYSNAGYIVLGAALESMTSKSWETLMKEEVFGPLAMSHCGFGPTATPESPDHVRGHIFRAGQFEVSPLGPKSDNPPVFGPAGTVHCNLASWANFIRLHLGAGPKGYLKPETIKRLHTPSPKSKYAFGWIVPKPSILVHEGSNSMNHAFAIVNRKQYQAILVVTNAGPPPKMQPILKKALPILMKVTLAEAGSSRSQQPRK